MFSRRGYPIYPPPSKKSGPGCPGCLFVLASCVCFCWLVVHNGTLSQLVGSRLTAPSPPRFLSGLTLAQPPPQSHEAYSVTGKPSLSAAFVNTVLARVHSPAAGTGQALYDLSVKY